MKWKIMAACLLVLQACLICASCVIIWHATDVAKVALQYVCIGMNIAFGCVNIITITR